MHPRLTVLTLGVSHLERSLAFYRDGLGLTTKRSIGTEFEVGAAVFTQLQRGVMLALWPQKSLAHDTGIPQTSPSSVSLGHNVNSKAEVDEVMAQAKNAGATIVKPAGDVFWGGYTGYFQDP